MFNLRPAYRLATNQERLVTFRGIWIRNAKVLLRIQNFVLLCLHNSIGVRDCLARRGLMTELGCPLCYSDCESILRALQDCEVVKPYWCQLGVNGLDNQFYTSNILDWLEENGSKHRVLSQYHTPWSTTFLFAIWLIWKHRNQIVLKNQRLNPHLAKEIIRRALEYTLCAASVISASIRKTCSLDKTRIELGKIKYKWLFTW